MEENLEEKSAGIEKSHACGQYNKAWRVVNEISGRKKYSRGQIAGAGLEERVSNWFNIGHFATYTLMMILLLRKSPSRSLNPSNWTKVQVRKIYYPRFTRLVT